MLTIDFFIFFDFQKSEKYFGKSKMDILKCPKSTFPKKSWKFYFFSLSYFEIYLLRMKKRASALFFFLFIELQVQKLTNYTNFFTEFF